MLNAWMRQRTASKKGIITVVLIAFVTTFVFMDAWAAVVEVPGALYEIPEAPRSYGAYSPVDIGTFSIPAHLGEIKYSFRGDSAKTVFHIQDAHCNRFAQRKISEIIDYLNVEYGISTINLEGGVGDYDLDVFTSISGKDIRREVADHFVKTGEINGAESYAINNPGKVKLWGVENKELYLANLKVYRDSLAYKDEVDKYLKELTLSLNNLKRHIFSPDLLKIDIEYNVYKAGNKDFREYLEFLIGTARGNGINVKQFSNIYLLELAMEAEEGIDFKRANIERNVLVDELKKGLSRNEVRELVKNSVSFKIKKMSRKGFYNYLLRKAHEMSISLDRFPMLSSYIAYISTYEAVDRSKVMDEMDSLEREIKGPLYQNNTQRQLDTLSRSLAITKNIFAITLTKTDYEYYIDNADEFTVNGYLTFIKKESPKYKITARSDANIVRLDEYREKIIKFYEYSFERDEAFLKNLRFDHTPKNTESTVLMTGGFHTENLCGIFENEGISYVSILPKFTSEKDYESEYFNLLAGAKTDLRRMLSSVLAKAATSTMAIASMLNRELGGAVYGEKGLTIFEAAVRVREEIVRLMRKNGGDARISLTADGEELYAEGHGQVVKRDILDILTDVRLAPFLKLNREVEKTTEKIKGAEEQSSLPETVGASFVSGDISIGENKNGSVSVDVSKDREPEKLLPSGGLIGKLYGDNGEILTGDFTISKTDDAIIVGHDDLGEDVVIKKAADITLNSKFIKRDLMYYLSLDGKLTTLTDGEKALLKNIQDKMEKVDEVTALEPNSNVMGIFDGDKFYLSTDIADDLLGLVQGLGEGLAGDYMAELKQEHEDIAALTMHTFMRGVGKDVRIAYADLAGELGEGEISKLELDDFVNKLDEKMVTRSMTDSEKALIRYNKIQNRKGFGKGLRGNKLLLYGLMDHLDPAGNAGFSKQMKILANDMRRNCLNVVLVPASNIVTASSQQTISGKVRRKFRKIGVETQISHYDTDLESMLKNKIQEAMLPKNEKLRSKIFVYCLTRKSKVIAEKFQVLYPGLIAIGNDISDDVNIDEVTVDEVRVVWIANVLLNDKRLRENFKMSPESLFESRMRMLTAFNDNGIIQENLNNATAGDLENIMQALYSGKKFLRITRIDWEEIRDWQDSQNEILRSL